MSLQTKKIFQIHEMLETQIQRQFQKYDSFETRSSAKI